MGMGWAAWMAGSNWFAARPPLSSGGSARAGRILGQDAELVALRIGERDPATAIGPAMIGEVRRSQREDPLHLLLVGAIHRAQVKVHPVLHLLRVGDGDEQQELAAVTRGDQAFLVSGLIRVVRIFSEASTCDQKTDCA